MPPGAIYLEEWGQSLQPQLQPTQLPVFFFFFHILLIISATAIRSAPPTAAVDNILAAPNTIIFSPLLSFCPHTGNIHMERTALLIRTEKQIQKTNEHQQGRYCSDTDSRACKHYTELIYAK